MALDSTLQHASRRALLASGAGGLLALIAQALARPWAVRATDGQPILAGTTNSATMPTRLDSTGTEGFTATGTAKGLEGWSPGGTGVRALSDAQTGLLGFSGVPTVENPIPAAPAKTGVFGYANQDENAIGVRGTSPLGTAVQGDGKVGVKALGGPSGYAIHAFNGYSGGVGIYAEAVEPAVMAVGVYDKSAIEAKSFGDGTAVLGSSGAGAPPAAPPKTGVLGYANQDADAIGVKGESLAGTGIHGRSATRTGVLGVSGGIWGAGPLNTGVFGNASQAGGVGVSGQASSGIGVSGFSASGPAGVNGSSQSNSGVVGLSTSGRGISGSSTSGPGVRGASNSGPGVEAFSQSSYGIGAYSTSSIAVYADSQATNNPAISGRANAGNTGVKGFSGGFAGPNRAKTGVHGYAAQDANSRGVVGQSTLGQGVRGEATGGTGGYFTATIGTALQVSGKAKFSRSGKIPVAAGAASATKTLAGVTTASMILALFATNEAGVWVRAAVAGAGSFTIYFNTPLPTSASVAYFVLN
jgi:hypothetical protein